MHSVEIQALSSLFLLISEPVRHVDRKYIEHKKGAYFSVQILFQTYFAQINA
jgi:hypothetical protein